MSALFSTTDLGLAAFLFSRGHTPYIADRSEEQKRFEFTSEGAAADAALYHAGGLAPAKLFYAAVREMKALVHRPFGTPKFTIGDAPHAGRR